MLPGPGSNLTHTHGTVSPIHVDAVIINDINICFKMLLTSKPLYLWTFSQAVVTGTVTTILGGIHANLWHCRRWASGKRSVSMNLQCSAIPWPPLGAAAPGCRGWCGSGLYSSHTSSCTGTEGKVAERARGCERRMAFLCFLFGLDMYTAAGARPHYKEHMLTKGLRNSFKGWRSTVSLVR